jgi:hypothetical protein
MNQTGKRPPNTGSRTAPIANALPVILPPLFSIVTMLTIPEISEISKRHIPIKKVKPTHSDLGLSTRREVIAIRAGKVNAKPQRAQVSEKLANLLIVTVTGCFESSVSVIEALQNRQTRASSGFSLPHFGQYIFILLIFFISHLWPYWQGRHIVFAERLEFFGIFRLWPG